MKTTTRMLRAILIFVFLLEGSQTLLAQTSTLPTQDVCVGSLAEPYVINPPTTGSTYQWTLTGGGVIVSGQGSDTIAIDWGIIAGGPHTLSIVETDATGCIGPPQIVDVTLIDAAIADAGLPADVCEGSSHTIVGATASNNTGISWSTTTGGTFSGGSTLTPTYTPSAADITAGSVTLTLTATGNVPCADAISTMILIIVPTPTPGPIYHN